LQLLRNNDNSMLGQITLPQLRVFEEFLVSRAWQPTIYRSIKDDPEWQELYKYEQRGVMYHLAPTSRTVC
jgi:hypothetical protein